MKNSEIKWDQREICEVLGKQIVANHTSLDAARMNKRRETTILLCTTDEMLEMPLFDVINLEVHHE